MVAEYVGQRQIRGKSVETIRIIDTKYGRQRLAYFDTRNSLLSSETEAGTTTHYVEHRWTGDVFTPFEIAVARPCFGCIARYRWHTELNLDLTPDGTMLVVTYKTGNAIGFWDLEHGRETARMETSRTIPHGVVVTPDGEYAFVTLEGVGDDPGTVEVYRMGSGERVGAVDVGKQAGGIAFWKTVD